jgi:uncharacterized membrane protein YkvI
MPDVRVVLKVAGAFVAFLIGAGFATGQEILQFFASEGLRGVGGALIFLAGGTYLTVSLLLLGHRHGFHDSGQVFTYYAGPVAGAILTWYTVIVLYSVYVVMLAGAGALLHQHLDVPVPIGSALMALAVFATLYFGLHGLVEVIGHVGPMLVALIILIAGTAVLRHADRVSAGDAIVGSLDMLHASSSWWMSGILYAAMISLGLAAFLPALGATIPSRRDLVYAGVAGPLLYTLALVLSTLALLGGLPDVNGTMIPMLQLAAGAVPFVVPIFPWIILAGIFTTAAPMLWIATVSLAQDGSPRYRTLAAALSVLGYACGVALPYDRLLNLIYPTVGYLGFVLIACMLLKQVRTRSIG